MKSHKNLFPLSTKYDKKWVIENSLGDNPLYLAESLSEVMSYKPGQRVLELACGKAASSIFLAKEFDIHIFALDRWIDPTDNYMRAKDMGVEEKVIPVKSDVRRLPFPKNYFDAIIAANSFLYFGTDDRYLPYICQFLKPHGTIGIIDSCFSDEIHNLELIPQLLRESYQKHWYYVHSLDWWVHHWKKTGLVNIVHSGIIPGSNYLKEDFINMYEKDPDEKEIVDFLKEDTENFIQTFRLVGEKTSKKIYLEPDEQQL
jgi:cyclopropane fatty-acyl-phospholipid synthase-like methyltransferase